MHHEQRKGDARYKCRYCSKSFVVAIMTTAHEDQLTCPESRRENPPACFCTRLDGAWYEDPNHPCTEHAQPHG